MGIYKSYRYIDGKARWVIKDNDFNVIKNPTKEQITSAIIGNPPKKCCKCGSDKTYVDSFGRSQWFKYFGDDNENKKEWDRISWLCYECHKIFNYKERHIRKSKCEGRKYCICGSNDTYIKNWIPQWRKYYDKEGNWGENSWLCHRCYNRLQYHKSGTYINIKKLMAKSRMGELSFKDDVSLGLIGEAVIAKVRKLKVISVENDCLNSRYDLSSDPKYGIIQAKLRSSCYGQYSINIVEHNFDTLFVLCTDADMNNIIKIFAIPKEYIDNNTGLTIIERAPNDEEYLKYEKFRLDEMIYNVEYQSLTSYLKNKKYFGIFDIKDWLEEVI